MTKEDFVAEFIEAATRASLFREEFSRLLDKLEKCIACTNKRSCRAIANYLSKLEGLDQSPVKDRVFSIRDSLLDHANGGK